MEDKKDFNWLLLLKIILDTIKNIFIFIIVVISAFWSALVDMAKKY